MPLSIELRAVNLATRAERFSYGKKLRQHVPRERHADLKGVGSRSAVAILAEVTRSAFLNSSQNATSV